MKKNRMMRVASALLVAVLLTTCAISGTYAKYVTSDEGSDSARVAKFGVNITVAGGLFSETYIDAPATGDAVTVKTSGAVDSISKLVAPGTQSAANGLNFSVTGTPEVDVRVYFDTTDFGSNVDKDVFLKAGTYKDVTTSNADDEFVLAKDYYPVKYTLKKNGVAVTGAENVTLAQLKTVLDSYTFDVKANTDLATAIGTYTIEWVWDYGTASSAGNIVINDNDKADTILGDLAAGTYPESLTAGDDYNLTTGLNVKIAVEQIN